nr:hypothetical protein [Listeria monocytogenes]
MKYVDADGNELATPDT